MEMSPKQEKILSFDNVRAWYSSDHTVIKCGGMIVQRNSVLGLVGKNGAGKTTLVNSLCGIHRDASFENLLYEGSECTPQDLQLKNNRYACFAKDESFRYWSLGRLVALLEASFSLKRDEEYLECLIDGFALNGLDTVRLSELSSGQRKKAALVSAFYTRRKLLLLDEPVDFLDFSSTEFLYETIRSYSASYGSIIMCSHIAESFTRCCSQIYVLEEGTITGPYDVPERAEDVVQILSR